MRLKKSLGLMLAMLAIVGGSLMAVAAPNTAASTSSITATKIVPVHINTATLTQLKTLPGVGTTLAKQIIKHRPYKNAQDLQAKVKGIGPKLWSKMAPYVLFN
ncbi:MAG: helix-hairpin-helix domain-containing protein [Meiothermus sp.]|jgi:competence protein ComEA|nr:helix-hairpin-helix domain-containing protein [Meiothermus sp.]